MNDTRMRPLEDRIHESLLEQGEPVPAEELAERFLQAGGSGARVGAQILEKVLGRDRRFRRSAEGWEALLLPARTQPIEALSWTVLLAERIPAGSGATTVLGIIRHHPGSEEDPPPATLVMPASRFAGLELAATLSREWGRPCEALPPKRFLGVLEAAFREEGLRILGFSSAAIAGLLAEAEQAGIVLPEELPRLSDICRLFFPPGVRPTLETTLTRFQVEHRRETGLVTELTALPDLIPELVEALSLAGIASETALMEKIESLHPPLDLSPYEFGAVDLAGIPEEPGVYLLRDENGHLVYVGKSVNLKRRLTGYFRFRAQEDPKLERIQELTRRFEFRRTGSDLEALLEEAQLIAQHRPPINIQMEVHEAPSEKPLSDLILALLPSSGPESVRLFALRPAGTLHACLLRREAPDIFALEEFLKACADVTRTPPEVYPPALFPLALRWLRRNAHQVTYLRYHDYPTPQAAVSAILGAVAAQAEQQKEIRRT